VLRRARLLFLGLCVCGVLAAPIRARAEGADPARTAAARTAFDEGVERADAHDFEAARTLFERAMALRDSPVIRFNLGMVLVELGKLVEASELFRTLSLDERAAAELRGRAGEQYEALRPRLAFLRVVLEPASASAQVELDTRTLSADELGMSMPVDPGEHALRATREGRALAVEHVRLDEGEARSVSLQVSEPAAPVLAAAAPLPLAPAPLSPPVDEAEPHPKRKRRIAWAIAGTAVALASGALTGFLLAGRRGGGGSHGDFDPPSVGVKVAP
jgi:hypothetical protein